jgi:hypothetical protein
MNVPGVGKGCPVQVVGPGTPAAEAKLKVGDVIQTVDGKAVWDDLSLRALLKKDTKPGQTVHLTVLRAGKELALTATLRRRPLEVVKPEDEDPLSLLATLQQFDAERLPTSEKKPDEKEAAKDKEKEAEKSEREIAEEKEQLHKAFIAAELDGVRLRTANWKLVA